MKRTGVLCAVITAALLIFMGCDLSFLTDLEKEEDCKEAMDNVENILSDYLDSSWDYDDAVDKCVDDYSDGDIDCLIDAENRTELISCGTGVGGTSDGSSSEDGSSANSFNPPSWIQGTWSDGTFTFTFTFSENNVIGMGIDFDETYGSGSEYVEVTENYTTDNEYRFELYSESNQNNNTYYDFKKVSATTLTYTQGSPLSGGATVGPITLTKQ